MKDEYWENLLSLDKHYLEWEEPERQHFENQFRKLTNDLLPLRHQSLEAVTKYLFFSNAGGAAAVLGFIGTASTKISAGPLAALAFYLIGVMLMGFFHFTRYYYLDGVIDGFNDDVFLCMAGEAKVYETLRRYDLRPLGKYGGFNKNIWQYRFGWLSFSSFILGSVIGFSLLL